MTEPSLCVRPIMPLDVARGTPEATAFHGDGRGAPTTPSLPRLKLLGAMLGEGIRNGLAGDSICRWVFPAVTPEV